MRRGFQLSGLSGLLVTALTSAHAFAQEPKEAEAQTPAEEGKTDQPAPTGPAAEVAAPAAEVVAPAAAPLGPAAKPKVGDLTTHGYFRGGFGANVFKRGRMTCFGLTNITGGLKSKYRLGNECEQWGEFHLNAVMYVGDDGSVGTFHFTPAAYLPTSYAGYSPTSATSIPDQGWKSTGGAVSFPNLYADIKGISWLFGGAAWAGGRYYKREDVYISDFFYWNPSGIGGGIEDVRLGKIWESAPDALRDVTFSYAAFAVDGQPNADPPLPAQIDLGIRNDLQVRGFRPYASGELQLGFQYIADWSNDKDTNGRSNTHGGWGVTLRHVQDVLGGTNKAVVQYGKGGGTGFGTLSRFYYPDFSLRWAPVESRLRLLDVLTIQPQEWLGTQLVGSYQRDDDGLGNPDSINEWFSFGGRLSLGILDHLKLLGEAGYDHERKSNGAPPLWLFKATGAVAITSARGFWARPEIRLFVTWAVWAKDSAIGGIDSGRIYTESYTNDQAAALVGLQGEAMW
jgi:maltoporin